MQKTSSFQGTKLSTKQSAGRMHIRSTVVAAAAEAEPLLVRAARGEVVERAPAWMMRQAGRYQKVYRDLAVKFPSFRVRSETTDLITEITLQPFRSFKPDGIILFSDILTPFPAYGVPFEIDDNKGPVLDKTIRSMEDLKMLHKIDLSKVSFVGEALTQLRNEVKNEAAVLGFIGSPWTLATYLVEGGSSSLYKTIKGMCYSNPQLLDAILSHLAEQQTEYVRFQIDSGAQAVQIFDSWGGQLPPAMWDKWSRPYIEKIVKGVKATHPKTPLTLYANGSSGLLERIGSTGVDVIGLDWQVDMADARARLPRGKAVQGNVDPVVLFASKEAITDAVRSTVVKAGKTGHILNLGHGVLVGTPEENVAHFFDVNRSLRYEDLVKTDVLEDWCSSHPSDMECKVFE